MSTARLTLRVHPDDQLIVALRDLKAGSVVDGITLREDIAAKHKFAAQDFAVGEKVTMYGVTVGRATQAIPAGALVHTHNLKHEAAGFEGKRGSYV
jgi:altronate hydrolase